MARVKCYPQILMIIATLVLCGFVFPALIHAADLTVTLRHDEFYPSEEEGLWAATVRFNHPVFPSDAGASIKVTRDGKDESFELLDQTTFAKAKEASRGFVIRSEKKSTEPAKIVIVVQKGLATRQGGKSWRATTDTSSPVSKKLLFRTFPPFTAPRRTRGFSSR